MAQVVGPLERLGELDAGLGAFSKARPIAGRMILAWKLSRLIGRPLVFTNSGSVVEAQGKGLPRALSISIRSSRNQGGMGMPRLLSAFTGPSTILRS